MPTNRFLSNYNSTDSPSTTRKPGTLYTSDPPRPPFLLSDYPPLPALPLNYSTPPLQNQTPTTSTHIKSNTNSQDRASLLKRTLASLRRTSARKSIYHTLRSNRKTDLTETTFKKRTTLVKTVQSTPHITYFFKQTKVHNKEHKHPPFPYLDTIPPPFINPLLTSTHRDVRLPYHALDHLAPGNRFHSYVPANTPRPSPIFYLDPPDHTHTLRQSNRFKHHPDSKFHSY